MSVDIEDFEFAVSERFHHALSREAVYSAPTPRELAAALMSHAAGGESRVSLTARGFYRIRRWMADVLDVDARSITPSTRLVDLLPDLAIRRLVWTHFREMLGIRQAPRLYRPRIVSWSIAILAGTAGLTAMLLAASITSSLPLFYSVGGVVAAASIWALSRLTLGWAYDFIPPGLTVGALAHYVVAYGSPVLGELALPVSRSQTLEVVQSLARLEIGARHVHPDATWEQLGDLARAS